MKIEATPKEIAALVAALQERRECKTQEIKLTLDSKEIFRAAFGAR